MWSRRLRGSMALLVAHAVLCAGIGGVSGARQGRGDACGPNSAADDGRRGLCAPIPFASGMRVSEGRGEWGGYGYRLVLRGMPPFDRGVAETRRPTRRVARARGVALHLCTPRDAPSGTPEICCSWFCMGAAWLRQMKGVDGRVACAWLRMEVECILKVRVRF